LISEGKSLSVKWLLIPHNPKAALDAVRKKVFSGFCSLGHSAYREVATFTALIMTSIERKYKYLY